MERYPVLNFPEFSFRTGERDGVPRVWDDLRGKWLQLTPEEWVRRHLIQFLVTGLGVDLRFIVQEHPVPLQGQPQRADVVVMAPGDRMPNALKDSAVCADPRPRPLLLAECKAADVAIDQGVFSQAVRYNSVVGARFLLLTNGLKHYCYEADGHGGYRPLTGMPDLSAFFAEK